MSADKSADDIENLTSRRRLLRQMGGVSLALPFAQWKPLPVWAQAPAPRTDRRGKELAPLPPPTALSLEDDKFLDDLERSSFLFFWEQANPQTGLIKDRCNVRINDTGVVASVASTGFGLTSICIAAKRGYISHQDARLRDPRISLEKAADTPRILLSLRQHQYRRKNLGLRSLFRRHGIIALRHPDLPPALSGSRHRRPGTRNLRPRGRDLAFRSPPPAPHGLDT